MSLIELMKMFPTEEAATAWFEDVLWAGERCCGKCGSVETRTVPHAKPMPYWCPSCRSYFSVRTGTAIARSNVPLRKWAIAIYLCLTSLKSVSSMKLHRDLGVSQKTAWFMLHRIREAWAEQLPAAFAGPVEADETFVGGRAKNMHAAKRKQLTGRGGADKSVVAGVKDRATGRVRASVVARVDGPTLTGFVEGHAKPDAVVYTDEHQAYATLANRHTVKHGVGEWVRDQIHINGMESFWSMLKRAHMGTFHKAEPEAPGPLRAGVRWQAQHAELRNAYADADDDRAACRPEPALPGAGSRKRPQLGGAVGVAASGAPALAS